MALLAASCGDNSAESTGDAGDDRDEGSQIGAVVLETLDRDVPDPFVEARLDLVSDLESVATEVGAALSDGRIQLPGSSSGDAGELAGRTSDGGEPGLYGGTRQEGECDRDQMVSFLTDPANRDQAAAWAQSQGLEADEVGDYIEGLTPVRLLADTRVTNHGYDAGSATPYQAVLQAGTSVLVDDQGVPRARCYCGNPLGPPEPVTATDTGPGDLEDMVENPDDAWEGFDPAEVLVVEPGETMDSLVVVDIETGETYERPVGTTGSDDPPADPAEEPPAEDPPATDPPAEEPPPTEPPATAPPTSAQEPDPGGGGGPPDRGVPIESIEQIEGTCRATYTDGVVIEYAC